jgi:hypothetical protein
MASISERYGRLLEAGLVLAADLSLPATLQRIVELGPTAGSAQGLGGTAEIHSTPGQGTQVRITIPR